MALAGTGSNTAGWSRPFYLTSATNYPVAASCWIRVPVAGNASVFWGLTGANAVSMALYYQPTSTIYWDQVNDLGAGPAAADPQSIGLTFTGDGVWHHVAYQMISGAASVSGKSSRFWYDGVEMGDTTGIANNLGAQTFNALHIGFAPTVGVEPAFDTASAVAELCVFRSGSDESDMQEVIRALAQGANPLRVPGRHRLWAYHPLRRNFQDYVSQRVGFAASGSPGEPVWVDHPKIDPVVVPHRLSLVHTAAALATTATSTDSGTAALSTAIVLVGPGPSTDTGSGSLLASAFLGLGVSRDSATASLRSGTELIGTGSSSDTGLALSGSAIMLLGSSASSDDAIASLTVPSIAANTRQLQNALVDTLVRNQPFLAPTTWYLALVTQLGDTTTPGVEVNGGSYARVSSAASLANWAGTQGPGTTAVSNGTDGITSNNAALIFPAPTTDWGTVVGYELWDAPAGGNRWISGKLQTAVAIANGSGARRFAAGTLTISIR